ncbi:hypothetical protein CALVIDRAFT_598753 [Calocera viscosa TUFC12733]|uniref:F-box domain-containing protein n=1 Tax=Calocera viscosa (strain TUFC12733) TaxID=1330018 RepID=A0A167LVQ5_CALVF|nr:hypothetical protein CALVIDRAFT_598753 [Calocera viscosa TUFC12733]
MTIILDEDLLRWNIYTPFVQGIYLMPCFLDDTVTAADARGRIDIDKRNWHIMHLMVRIKSTLGGMVLPNLTGLGIGCLTTIMLSMAIHLKKPELTSVILDLATMHEKDASLLAWLDIFSGWEQIEKMKVFAQQVSDEARRVFWTLNDGWKQLKSFSLYSAFGESRFLLPILGKLPHLSELVIQGNWKLFPDPVHGDMVNTLWKADYIYAAEIKRDLRSGAFHQLTDLNLTSGARFCAALLHAIRGPLSRVTISTTFALLDEFRTLVMSILGSEHQPRRELKHLSLGFQNCWNCFVLDSCWAVLCRLQPLDLYSFDFKGIFNDDTTQDYRITDKGVAYLTSKWHNLRHLRMETFHIDSLETVRPMQKILR